MAKHHTVVEVASLALVGLVATVALMISLSSWNPSLLGFALGLIGVTGLIWTGGWRGALGTTAGLLGVAIVVRGFVGIVALVVLFTWAGEQTTRLVRQRESAKDAA